MTHWLLTYKLNLQQTERFTVEMIDNKDFLPAGGGQRKLSVSAQAVMELIKPLWSIYNMFDTMKINDQQCPHVLQRLKALEKLVLFMLKKEPEELSDDVNEAFGKFNKVLLSAEELIKEFSDKMKVVQMVKSSDYKLEFDNLNKSLTDAFVALSGALHVEEEKELQGQKIRLTEQEKKMFEQERKLTEQEEKMVEQERKLDEQEEKTFEQERKLAKQEKELAEQREKLAEQKDMLQKLESKLSYRYNCTVQ